MAWLLDTHALLWWQTDDARLPERVRATIADPGNPVFVSAASAWEIATKVRLGKLSSAPEAATRHQELLAADGFLELPIKALHALRAGAFDVEHRDPFDRLLAAQAEIEGLVLVTRDPAFRAFRCRTLW